MSSAERSLGTATSAVRADPPIARRSSFTTRTEPSSTAEVGRVRITCNPTAVRLLLTDRLPVDVLAVILPPLTVPSANAAPLITTSLFAVLFAFTPLVANKLLPRLAILMPAAELRLSTVAPVVDTLLPAAWLMPFAPVPDEPITFGLNACAGLEPTDMASPPEEGAVK